MTISISCCFFGKIIVYGLVQIAFKNVSKQANRIKCATIGWKAMKEMIEEWEKNQ